MVAEVLFSFSVYHFCPWQSTPKYPEMLNTSKTILFSRFDLWNILCMIPVFHVLGYYYLFFHHYWIHPLLWVPYIRVQIWLNREQIHNSTIHTMYHFLVWPTSKYCRTLSGYFSYIVILIISLSTNSPRDFSAFIMYMYNVAELYLGLGL